MVIAALLCFAVLLIAWMVAPERSERTRSAGSPEESVRIALSAPIYEIQAALDG